MVGGLEGIRTLDPHNANVVRSQLRYKPIARYIIARSGNFVKRLDETDDDFLNMGGLSNSILF